SLDSAVEGIKYISGDQTGNTGPDGLFKYVVGESVQFSIGGISSGTVTPKEKMTPIDVVANATDSTNQIVINIARLLQSLDSDGNPANGIAISAEMTVALQDASLDLTDSSTDFENAFGAIKTDIANTHGITVIIVTENDAKAHRDDTIVAITTGNSAPVANAGTDQNVSTGSTVTLNGSSSSDADKGDTLTYSWSITSKPSLSFASLSNSTSVNPTFTADVDGTYVISLVVNDGTVNSVADTVSVVAPVMPYSMSDLVGTWYAVGLRAPQRGVSTDEHGYDVGSLTIQSDLG
ncbi:MAG: hypothetical protein HQ517_03305, partial [SAR324 cluster bacterium]|nr:hypothetical protein [SAR324 cluster bacterium]